MEISHHEYKQMLDTNWMSDSLIQSQHSLYGDSVRSHRLRAQSHKIAHCLAPHFSDTSHKLRLSSVLLITPAVDSNESISILFQPVSNLF